MASAMIHLAVAKTLEKYLDIKNPRDYYLGSIAPDISKQLGDNKQRSHFLFNTRDDIPNLDLFREKYPNFKDNSFDLGYYIHLYTDRLWFAHFLPLITSGNYIKLLDGTVIFSAPQEMQGLLYQDYTNLNVQLIDEYNLEKAQNEIIKYFSNKLTKQFGQGFSVPSLKKMKKFYIIVVLCSRRYCDALLPVYCLKDLLK